MCERLANDQQNCQRIDDWSLALLRFAITLDTADPTAAVELVRRSDAGETGGAIRSTTPFRADHRPDASSHRLGKRPKPSPHLATPPGADRKSPASQSLSGCGRPRDIPRSSVAPSWPQFICRLREGLAIHLDRLRGSEPYSAKVEQVWSLEMRGSAHEASICYRPTEHLCRITAAEKARTPHPMPQRMLFEIGVTLAAALSVAFVGNILAISLGG
jgi:hypothetical protein